MGFLDDAEKDLGKAVDSQGERIGEGLDKAGEYADKRTGDKYDHQVAEGVQKAKDGLDGLDGKDDDIG